MYVLRSYLSTLYNRGPAESTPVAVKGADICVRNSGSLLVIGGLSGFLRYLLQRLDFLITVFTILLSFGIQTVSRILYINA